jgi:hypothetical protein
VTDNLDARQRALWRAWDRSKRNDASGCACSLPTPCASRGP